MTLAEQKLAMVLLAHDVRSFADAYPHHACLQKASEIINQLALVNPSAPLALSFCPADRLPPAKTFQEQAVEAVEKSFEIAGYYH